MWIRCLCEVLYIAQVLIGMKYLFQQNLTNKRWRYVVACFILVAAKAYLLMPGQTLPEPPIIYLLETLTILFLVEGKIFRRWCLYLVIDTIFAAFQILFMYIMFLFTNKSFRTMESSWELDFYGGIIIIILMLIFRGFMKKYAHFLKFITWYQMLIIFIGGVLLLLMTIQIERSYLRSSPDEWNSFWNQSFLMFILGFGLLFFVGAFLFVLIDNSRKYYLRENELKDEFLEMQTKYYQMLSYKDHEIKKFRHDMKNHYYCMESLLHDQNYEELEKYLESFGVQLLKIVDRPLESGNDLVNAILTEIAVRGKEHGIEILLKGSLVKELTIDTPDLCSLFYNLVSNAVEACERYNGVSQKEVILELKFYKENLIISISNPVSEPVNIQKLGKGTSKKDKANHGYGMQNIFDIVKNYNGTIEFSNLEGQFIIEIILNGAVMNYR